MRKGIRVAKYYNIKIVLELYRCGLIDEQRKRQKTKIIKEEMYWRQKQYDYEWESDYLNAKFCRDQTNYYKN